MRANDASGPVRLRVEEFDTLTRHHGMRTDAERARGLHLHHATVSRVRQGKQLPGAVFIDAVLRTFGPTVYSQLFYREES